MTKQKHNTGFLVFFAGSYFTWQACKRKVIENDAAVIYSYGVLSAFGAYK